MDPVSVYHQNSSGFKWLTFSPIFQLESMGMQVRMKSTYVIEKKILKMENIKFLLKMEKSSYIYKCLTSLNLLNLPKNISQKLSVEKKKKRNLS